MTEPALQMGQLLIPFALDPSGSLVRAAAAGSHAGYTCPGCSELLLLRNGVVRQAHFAHRSGFQGHGESEQHRLAKYNLALLLVDEATASKPRFPIFEPCVDCGRGLRRSLPPFVTVAVERRLSADRIADVALLDASEALAAVVEVRVRHATDPDRAAPPDIPWVEVFAADGLDKSRWRVVAASRDLRCVDCGRRQRARATAQRGEGVATDPTPIEEPRAIAPKQLPLTVAPSEDPEAKARLTVITTPSSLPAWRVATARCGACAGVSRFYEWDGGDPAPRLPRAGVTISFEPPRWMSRCLWCDAVLPPAAGAAKEQ